MENSINKKSEELENIQSHCTELSKEHSSLEATLALKEKEMKVLLDELSELKVSKGDLNNSHAMCADKIKALETRIQEKDSELSAKEIEISKLKQCLDEKNNTHMDMESKLRVLEEELQTTKRERELIYQEREKHRNMEEHVEKKLKESLDAKDEEIRMHEASVFNLKKELRMEKNKSRTMNFDYKKLSKKISSLEEKLEEKNQDIFELQKEISSLKEQLDSKNQAISELQKECIKLKENQPVSEDIHRIKQQRDVYLNKWMELERDHTRQMMEKGKEILNLKDEVEMLKNQKSLKKILDVDKADYKETNTANANASEFETLMKPPDTLKASTPVKIKQQEPDKRVPPTPLIISGGNSKPTPKPGGSQRPNFFASWSKAQVETKTDPFETSGSDYMELEHDSGKEVKLIPVKKTSKRKQTPKSTPIKNLHQTPLVDVKKSKTSVSQKDSSKTPNEKPASKSAVKTDSSTKKFFSPVYSRKKTPKAESTQSLEFDPYSIFESFEFD